MSDRAWAMMTLWQEGRGDRDFDELVGRAEVIVNRMQRRYQSDGTVAGTILRAEQFSGWNAHDPNRIPSATIDDQDGRVQLCAGAWSIANAGQRVVTNGALLYYDGKVAPSWAAECEEAVVIGTTHFLRPK